MLAHDVAHDDPLDGLLSPDDLADLVAAFPSSSRVAPFNGPSSPDDHGVPAGPDVSFCVWSSSLPENAASEILDGLHRDGDDDWKAIALTKYLTLDQRRPPSLPGSLDTWLPAAADTLSLLSARLKEQQHQHRHKEAAGAGLRRRCVGSFESEGLSGEDDDCGPAPEGYALATADSHGSMCSSGTTLSLSTAASGAFSSAANSGDNLCGLAHPSPRNNSLGGACSSGGIGSVRHLGSSTAAPPAMQNLPFDCLPDMADPTWLGFDTGVAAPEAPGVFPDLPHDPHASGHQPSKGRRVVLARPCSPEQPLRVESRAGSLSAETRNHGGLGYGDHWHHALDIYAGVAAPTPTAAGAAAAAPTGSNPDSGSGFILDAASFWIYPGSDAAQLTHMENASPVPHAGSGPCGTSSGVDAAAAAHHGPFPGHKGLPPPAFRSALTAQLSRGGAPAAARTSGPQGNAYRRSAVSPPTSVQHIVSLARPAPGLPQPSAAAPPLSRVSFPRPRRQPLESFFDFVDEEGSDGEGEGGEGCAPRSTELGMLLSPARVDGACADRGQQGSGLGVAEAADAAAAAAVADPDTRRAQAARPSPFSAFAEVCFDGPEPAPAAAAAQPAAAPFAFRECPSWPALSPAGLRRCESDANRSLLDEAVHGGVPRRRLSSELLEPSEPLLQAPSSWPAAAGGALAAAAGAAAVRVSRGGGHSERRAAAAASAGSAAQGSSAIACPLADLRCLDQGGDAPGAAALDGVAHGFGAPGVDDDTQGALDGAVHGGWPRRGASAPALQATVLASSWPAAAGWLAASNADGSDADSSCCGGGGAYMDLASPCAGLRRCESDASRAQLDEGARGGRQRRAHGSSLALQALASASVAGSSGGGSGADATAPAASDGHGRENCKGDIFRGRRHGSSVALLSLLASAEDCGSAAGSLGSCGSDSSGGGGAAQAKAAARAIVATRRSPFADLSRRDAGGSLPDERALRGGGLRRAHGSNLALQALTCASMAGGSSGGASGGSSGGAMVAPAAPDGTGVVASGRGMFRGRRHGSSLALLALASASSCGTDGSLPELGGSSDSRGSSLGSGAGSSCRRSYFRGGSLSSLDESVAAPTAAAAAAPVAEMAAAPLLGPCLVAGVCRASCDERGASRLPPPVDEGAARGGGLRRAHGSSLALQALACASMAGGSSGGGSSSGDDSITPAVHDGRDGGEASESGAMRRRAHGSSLALQALACASVPEGSCGGDAMASAAPDAACGEESECGSPRRGHGGMALLALAAAAAADGSGDRGTAVTAAADGAGNGVGGEAGSGAGALLVWGSGECYRAPHPLPQQGLRCCPPEAAGSAFTFAEAKPRAPASAEAEASGAASSRLASGSAAGGGDAASLHCAVNGSAETADGADCAARERVRELLAAVQAAPTWMLLLVLGQRAARGAAAAAASLPAAVVAAALSFVRAGLSGAQWLLAKVLPRGAPAASLPSSPSRPLPSPPSLSSPVVAVGSRCGGGGGGGSGDSSWT